jgi:hypothetical protein
VFAGGDVRCATLRMKAVTLPSPPTLARAVEFGAPAEELETAVDARRAFMSCAQKARVGPVGECRALLR